MALTKSGTSALVWTVAVFSVLVVTARTFVRIRIRAIGIDDYLMLLAATWFVCFAGLDQALHSTTQTFDLRARTNMSTLSTIVGLLCSHAGRTSVGCLLLRVLSSPMKWQRWLISFCIAGMQVLIFLELISGFLPICKPNLPLAISKGCNTAEESLAYNQSWNFFSVFVDIVFSTLPLTVIYKLNLSKNRKIALGMLLGLGWVASVFVLLRAISVYANWSADTTNTVVAVSSVLEQGLVIIGGSLVTLVPLYNYWTTGAPIQPRKHANFHEGNTKRPFFPGNSVSTAGTASHSVQLDSLDRTTHGIHVQKDFDVTSSHENTSAA